MQKRTLGTTRWGLPTIGLGCMGLSEFYGPPMEHRAAINLLHEAVDLGIEHFDTAELYCIGGAVSVQGAGRFTSNSSPAEPLTAA